MVKLAIDTQTCEIDEGIQAVAANESFVAAVKLGIGLF